MLDFKNGTFSKLKRVNTDSVMSDVHDLLIKDEELISAYKGLRDYAK